MYRHLMVPVDDSALSAANVDAAVRLAHQLSAQITFFHATADFGATGEGELMRVIAPASFRDEALGETHQVLAKAMASGASQSVPCVACHRTSDRPAEAIVQAAKEQDCDLIVMASRGAPGGIAGWLHTSQTERVLRDSPVALLVTRVGAKAPPTASERALAVVLDEHRSIAAVVRGLQDLVCPAYTAAKGLDMPTIRSLLAYLQAFPLQMHHPKEEEFLHRFLHQRSPDCDALLQQLEAQHRDEHANVTRVVASVDAVQAGDAASEAAAGAALVAQVQVLADAVWKHLSLEEREVLPLARRVLQEADWEAMATAFESHAEPSIGDMPATEFRKLFTRIANLLPATRGERL